MTPAAVIKDVLKFAAFCGAVLGAMRPALLILFWPWADHLRKELSDSVKPAVVDSPAAHGKIDAVRQPQLHGPPPAGGVLP